MKEHDVCVCVSSLSLIKMSPIHKKVMIGKNRKFKLEYLISEFIHKGKNENEAATRVSSDWPGKESHLPTVT